MRTIRPLGVMGIIRESLSIYGSHFLTLLGISAVSGIPSLLYAATGTKHGAQPLLDALLGFLGFVVSAALVLAVASAYLGRTTCAASCLRRVLDRTVLLSVLGSALLSYALLQLPGSALTWLLPAKHEAAVHKPPAVAANLAAWLVIAWCIFGMLRLSVFVAVVAVERRGAVASFRRSWSLMQGNMLKAARLFFVLVVPWVAVAMFSMHLRKHPSTTTRLEWAVLGMLITPVFVSALTILYFDIRCRKEGFDNNALAGELDSGAVLADTSGES